MKKTYFGKLMGLALAACATLGFQACSDDDSWVPGEPDADGVMGVYFASDNETGFSTEDNATFEIRLMRLDSTSAAKVKIVKDDVDASLLAVPDSVEFKAGEASAVLTVDASGLQASDVTQTAIKLSVDSAQVSPYAAGMSSFSATVAGKLWRVLVKDAQWYWASKTALPSWYSDIEQYLDQNRFRIKDFLGSGIDWEFRIQSASESLYYGDYTNLEGDVTTWMGSVDFEYDENHTYNYDGSWLYFMPDMANSVYGWTVPGSTLGYGSFSCYVGYSYIDFTQNYFQTWAYGMGDDADETDNSGYFYGYWTADQVVK